jgi:hypothetical protein
MVKQESVLSRHELDSFFIFGELKIFEIKKLKVFLFFQVDESGKNSNA